MKLGIVGLPNVGKSTLFNAITNAGAESANYPFCTIDPNVGMVAVPDHRLDKLAEMYHPKKTTPAVIEFVDIAGLVKGASRGEGLGNKFLGNIRMTDAIGEGKFDQAMSVLGELYQMQEPPIKIMWSVGRQMRQLYSARLALEQGRGPAYVAQLWGIKPYPSEKLMRSAKRFSLKWCRRAVVRCGQIDLAMKSSGQDGKELLTGLMLELANPT